MSLSSLRPFVPSGDDFQTAKQFFQTIGFEVNWEAEGVCELQMGEVTFLLQDFANRELQENLMLYVTVDDLDGFAEHLQALDLSTHYPNVKINGPKLFPWGERELHLIDPAGVCWHFS